MYNTLPRLLRTAFALWWITAARPGDVMLLRWEDVSMGPDQAVSVKFTAGKGVNIRGPYTVHTALPQDWRLEQEDRVWIVPPRLREQAKKNFLRALRNLHARYEIS
eukprot:PhM_4_TR17368/c2_g1_i10/m.34302